MQEHFLKDQIYYRTNEFKGGRQTLVFMHGVSGSSSAWIPYERIFKDKYNILNFDIRGHGMSKKFPIYSDFELANFATDLYDLVTHLKIPKFILISNSFSALIALEYIKMHRETVTANIFTSPEIYVYETVLNKIIRTILKLFTWILGFLPFNPKPRGHLDYSKHIGSTDWDVKRNWADMKNTGLRAHFFTLKKSFEKNYESLLENINMPTLVIHGEKDSMVPIKNALAISKKILNSEFITLKNIDHNTVHNAVEAISQAIESFIKKNVL